MGDPDAVPAFPILDAYDQAATTSVPFSLDFPCNWLQVLENCQEADGSVRVPEALQPYMAGDTRLRFDRP